MLSRSLGGRPCSPHHPQSLTNSPHSKTSAPSTQLPPCFHFSVAQNQIETFSNRHLARSGLCTESATDANCGDTTSLTRAELIANITHTWVSKKRKRLPIGDNGGGFPCTFRIHVVIVYDVDVGARYVSVLCVGCGESTKLMKCCAIAICSAEVWRVWI